MTKNLVDELLYNERGEMRIAVLYRKVFMKFTACGLASTRQSN